MADMSCNGGMGIQKHRKSGRTTKSPKMRHGMKMEAEKVSIKAKQYKMNESVKELFSK